MALQELVNDQKEEVVAVEGEEDQGESLNKESQKESCKRDKGAFELPGNWSVEIQVKLMG